jgi:hypothetical protein
MSTGRQDDIATRAYYIWEHEGRPEGRDQEHWFRALAEAENVVGGNSRRQRGKPASSGGRKSDLEGWLRSAKAD